MPKFMITCHTKNGQALPDKLMQETQANFLQLMRERYLEVIHISTSAKKLWLIMRVPNQPFAENILKNAPLAEWMNTEIEELNEA